MLRAPGRREQYMRRRDLLIGIGAGAAASGLPRATWAAEEHPLTDPALPEGTRQEATLESLPGKQPLVKLSYRPPNYESPLETFSEPITPNDRFFVRYHLAGIPEM